MVQTWAYISEIDTIWFIFFLLRQIRLKRCKNPSKLLLPGHTNEMLINTQCISSQISYCIGGDNFMVFIITAYNFCSSWQRPCTFIIISSMQTLVLPLWKWQQPSKNWTIISGPHGYLNPMWKLHGMPLGTKGVFAISPISQRHWCLLKD